MPAAYLHECVAKDAAQLLFDSGMDTTLFSEYEDAYLIGSQGPDPLFFHRILDPFTNFDIMHFGIKIHRTSTGAFLTALVQHAKGDPVAMTYVAGWLSHYATDCTFHPYVNAKTQKETKHKTSIAHGLLEHALDTWIYRKKNPRGVPRQVESFETIKHDEKDTIAKLLVRAAKDVFPDDHFTHKHAMDSFRSMNNIIKKLYSPNGKKLRFLSSAEGLFGIRGLVTSHTPPYELPEDDFINANREPWYSPFEKDRKRCESVEDLLIIATQRSSECIRIATRYWDDRCKLNIVSNALGNVSYGTGVPLPLD